MKKNTIPLLGACMMLKNESKRLHVTLNSLLTNDKPTVDCVVILDTGSTDNTLEIATNFCKQYNIKLHIKTTKWIDDFAFTRNEMLDFIDNSIEPNPLCRYALLLDCNDELKNGKDLKNMLIDINDREEKDLKKEAKKGKTEKRERINKIGRHIYPIGWKVCQNWWNGANIDQYYNIRLIKTRHQWRYKEPIHEYIHTPLMDGGVMPEDIPKLEKIILFQNRVDDDDKSKHRFAKDRIVFHREFLKQPTPRRVFYYAQTLKCLSQYALSYRYYKMRLDMGDYNEEIYEAYLSCGQLARLLNHDWEECLGFFLNACKVNGIGKRCEPMIEIVKYYYGVDSIGATVSDKNRNLQMALKFCKDACELEYPFHLNLFVKKYSYDYERYFLMALILKDILKENKEENKKDEYKKLYIENLNKCISFLEKQNDQIKNKVQLDNLKIDLENVRNN